MPMLWQIYGSGGRGMNLPREFELKIGDVISPVLKTKEGYLVNNVLLTKNYVESMIKDYKWLVCEKVNGENDIINKPSHYHKNEIDVNGYLEKHFPKEGEFTVSEGFYIGNALKYISRYKYKNGLEDLEKAAYYLGKLIDIEKGKITS